MRLKNGLVLRGVCSYANTLSSALVDQKLELRLIDQTFRRYYVSIRTSSPAVPDLGAVPRIEFRIPQRRTGRAAVPIQLGAPAISEFDENGQATVTFRLPENRVMEIRVGIVTLNSKFARIRGLTHDWNYAVAMTEIPEEILKPGILATSAEFRDGGSRLNMVSMLLDARRFDAANSMLDSISADFPELQPQVDTWKQTLREQFSSVVLEELLLRQAAGQIRVATAGGRLFPQENTTAQSRATALGLVKDRDRQLGQIDRTRILLNQLVAKFDTADPRRQQARQMVTSMLDSVDFNMLRRFYGAVELLALDTQQPVDAQLAYVVSAWMLGVEAATEGFTQTYGLFQIRQLILDYLNTDEAESELRTRLWERIRRLEGFSVDRVAALIKYLPSVDPVPVHFESALDPGRFRLRQTDQMAGCVGTVPPEYSESRHYPLIIAFPREEMTLSQTLKWWAGQAQRHGYIVVVPQLYDDTVAQYDASAGQHLQLLALIRQLKLGLRIDDDRIFVAGHGIGGEAAMDMATSHPDLFAGVISIAGIGRAHLKWTVHNAPQMPWYVVTGERQRGDLDRLEHMEQLLKNLFRRIDSSRSFCDALVVKYPERGFESFREEILNVFAWMQLHQRERWPSEIDVRILRSSDRNWYWLNLDDVPREFAQLDAPSSPTDSPTKYASLSARLTSNNALMIRSIPSSATLNLNPRMPGIDIAKPILVRVGSKSQRINFNPSVRDMLEELRLTGERERLCYMKVRLEK